MTRKLFALGILIAATLACTTKPADVKLSCPQGPSHALYNPGATKLNPWSITHNPAAAAQATITRAAGAATVKHVLTDLQACFSAGAATTVETVSGQGYDL